MSFRQKRSDGSERIVHEPAMRCRVKGAATISRRTMAARARESACGGEEFEFYAARRREHARTAKAAPAMAFFVIIFIALLLSTGQF
ncbi:hypothetical protein [Paramicrobacterium humi]|nr:hypothetical protein [Microbacterium humi]